MSVDWGEGKRAYVFKKQSRPVNSAAAAALAVPLVVAGGMAAKDAAGSIASAVGTTAHKVVDATGHIGLSGSKAEELVDKYSTPDSTGTIPGQNSETPPLKVVVDSQNGIPNKYFPAPTGLSKVGQVVGGAAEEISRIPEAAQLAIAKEKDQNPLGKTMQAFDVFKEFASPDTPQQKEAEMLFQDYVKRGDKFRIPHQNGLTISRDEGAEVFAEPEIPDLYHKDTIATLPKGFVVNTAIEVPKLLHPQKPDEKWLAVELTGKVGDKTVTRYGFVQDKNLSNPQPQK